MGTSYVICHECHGVLHVEKDTYFPHKFLREGEIKKGVFCLDCAQTLKKGLVPKVKQVRLIVFLTTAEHKEDDPAFHTMCSCQAASLLELRNLLRTAKKAAYCFVHSNHDAEMPMAQVWKHLQGSAQYYDQPLWQAPKECYEAILHKLGETQWEQQHMYKWFEPKPFSPNIDKRIRLERRIQRLENELACKKRKLAAYS